MVGYLKLKTNNEELYETDFLKNLKNKKTEFAMLQYYICLMFYEVVVFIKYLANIITIKQIYNGYIFIIPFNFNENASKCGKILNNELIKSKIIKQKKQKIQKCINNVIKYMQKYNIKDLVISEELKDFFSNKEMKVHLVDGRGLIPYLLYEILEYILENQGLKPELEDLYICVKDIKKIYLENIEYLSHFFRNIHIVTPYIQRFQKIADRIEEKENINLTITNNKRKSLKKAKLIINFNFTDKEFKKFTIYRRAVIISVEDEQTYDEIGFDGIQIKKIEIDASKELKAFFEKHNLLENCSLSELYESIVNKSQNLNEVKGQIQKDEVRIIKLYGKNSEICEF